MHIFSDSYPTCDVADLNESLQMTAVVSCRCDYSGDWIPVMQWTQSTNIIPHPTVSTTTRTLTSVLTVRRNVTTHERYEEIYHCRTYFVLDNKPNNTDANNVPGYTHLCNVVVTWPTVISNQSMG